MHVLSPTQKARIYLQFDELPEPCRPVLVVRDGGATLVTVDPRSTKFEATCYCADNLTAEELDAYREAFGAPSGTVAPDTWTSDEPVVRYVPPALRLRPKVTAISRAHDLRRPSATPQSPGLDRSG